MKAKPAIIAMLFLFAATSAAMLEQSAANGDSLWKKRVNNVSNLYTDNRARAIGDIVTIIISENTELKGEESTDLNKQASLTSETDASKFLTFLTKGKSKDFDSYMPNIDSETTNAFKGDGNYSSTRGVDLKMTALITDILPSGNLIVEGVRTVTINKETYNIKLSGIARPIDIMNSFRDPSGEFRNVIRSTSLANATVTLEGKGFLTRAGKRGWFWRLRDIIWPF